MPVPPRSRAVFGPFDGDFDPFDEDEDFGLPVTFGRGALPGGRMPPAP